MLSQKSDKNDTETIALAAEEDRLRKQVKKLIRQLDSLEEEFSSKELALKQIVGLLMVLSKTAVDQDVARLLDQLGREVKKGVHPPTLERLLDDIKARVAQEEDHPAVAQPQAAALAPRTERPSAPPAPKPEQPTAVSTSSPEAAKDKGKTLWGKTGWRKSTPGTPETPAPAQPAPPDVHAADLEEKIRAILCAMLDHLYIEGQHRLSEQIAQTKAVVTEGALLQRLAAVQQQLVDLLDHYRQIHEAERTRTEEVLKEFISKLVEIEKNGVHSLLANHQESMSDNAQFANRLEDHVSGLQEVAQLKDLTAIRQTISDRADRMRAAIQTKREFDTMISAAFEEKVHRLERQLHEANQQLSNMAQRAYHDVLLEGVYNRIAFNEKMQQEIAQFQRYHHPVSLILFDVDHFKQVNDTYGHQAGDHVLKTLATRVKHALRASDFLARYGGDELVIVLPHTPLSTAAMVAERLRTLAHHTRFSYDSEDITISLSLGVATASTQDTVETCLERADQALYLAKARGRNQMRTEEEVTHPAPSALNQMLGFLGKALPFKKTQPS